MKNWWPILLLPGALVLAFVLWLALKRSPQFQISGGSGGGGGIVGGSGGGVGGLLRDLIYGGGGGGSGASVSARIPLEDLWNGLKSLFGGKSDQQTQAEIAAGNELAAMGGPEVEKYWQTGQLPEAGYGPELDQLINPAPVDLNTVPLVPLNESVMEQPEQTAGEQSAQLENDLSSEFEDLQTLEPVPLGPGPIPVNAGADLNTWQPSEADLGGGDLGGGGENLGEFE